jgi:hypothetical protein
MHLAQAHEAPPPGAALVSMACMARRRSKKAVADQAPGKRPLDSLTVLSGESLFERTPRTIAASAPETSVGTGFSVTSQVAAGARQRISPQPVRVRASRILVGMLVPFFLGDRLPRHTISEILKRRFVRDVL